MKICKKPNFTKDQFSSSIRLNKISGNTIDELVESIYGTLKGDKTPFSVSYSESIDEETYEDGITQLIDTVKEKLNILIDKTDNEFIKSLKPSDKGIITKRLKELLMPKPLSSAEVFIKNAVIPEADLVTSEELQKIQYKNLLDTIYEGTNRSYDKWRLQNFEDNLCSCTILNQNKGTIINSNFDLNNNIIDYQQGQYNIIYDYLNRYVFNGSIPSDIFPKKFYTSKYDDTDVKIPTKNNKNIFLAMYNHIKTLKENGQFSNMIDNGYNEDFNKSSNSTQSRDLFRAVSAYANLRFFDATIKNSVGKFINVDNTKVIPISSNVDEMGDVHRVYKYTIAVGNNNAIKTWGATDNADAIKLVSDFNKFIISRIPIYDFKTKNKEFGQIEIKDFLGAFIKLKELGSLYTSKTNKFANYCKNITSESSFYDGNLSNIFDLLFEKNSDALIKSLQNLGFNYNDFNVLYSVYRTVFKQNTKASGEHSWYEIERDYALNTGLRSRYNLVDNLYGLICSNEALNYLQTQYNFDTGKYETSVKDKFSINRYKFSLKDYANRKNYSREQKSELLEQYNFIESKNGIDYSFKLGGITYNTHIKDNTSNILSKKHSPTGYEIKASYLKDGNLTTQDITDLFFGDSSIENIDLSKSENRENLLKAELSDFRNLLSFIDNILDTTFSKSPEALLEFNYSIRNQKSFLHDIVLSAVRGLAVNNIYNQLSQAKDSNGKPYSKIHIKQYMKDVGGWYNGIHDSTDQNEYFDKTQIGEYLNTVHANEAWVNTLAKSHAIINQDTSSSVTSNFAGDHIPNTSPAYLSASHSIKEQMHRASEKGRASGYLLFSNNENAIEVATVNLDVQTDEYKSKQQKDLTQGELFQDAIINKFLYPLIDNGFIYTQSTTQSDKTKFIANKVNLKAIQVDGVSLYDLCKKPELEEKVISAFQNTIGKAYQSVLNEVIKDYNKLFPQITTVDQVNDLLKGTPALLFDGKTVTTISNEKNLIDIVNAYNKINNSNLTLYKDLHYRQLKGGLAVNELLDEFATNLYANPVRLQSRINLEKTRFLNNLTKNMFTVEVTDQLRIAMNKMGVDVNEWTQSFKEPLKKGQRTEESHTYLVLAKSNGQNIFYGNVDETSNVQLNPILNTYFLVDNLIGNNIRFGTTGSEINHKIKALAKTNLRNELNKATNDSIIVNSLFGDGNITFHDLKNKINDEALPLELRTQLLSVYDNQIYRMENLGQNAQFKRNVIMSATMTKFIPSINGISNDMNIACIYDIGANVFNFTGEISNVDAHDGSAQVSPLWSILENKSLGTNEVGTVKKPIHHFYDDKYMTATLLKYATDAMTNNWMRQSIGNDINGNGHAINLYKIFKKMHHKRWTNADGTLNYGEIDLINGCGFKDGGKINFKKDILEGQELFYSKNGEHYKILDFGRDGKTGTYYTIEESYDAKHSSSGVQTKIYHYFDENGTHFPTEQLSDNPNLHTIDSLFELHSVLGGIWTESWDGDNFVFSESSNIATVNFINNVCNVTEAGKQYESTKKKKSPAELKYYSQPLKKAMIHMIANNSAVKNGVGNINPSTSWYDDSELSYMTISTKHYGIQQDSDHTADEAHMTEFSQVISSLDAGGYLHDYVSQIYEQLGQTAIELSQVELNAIKEFRETGNKSKLYDLIGRTIIANIKSGENSSSLSNAILSKIKKNFNQNSNHELDKLKIPFSDPNIYSQILSTFVSNINQKSIKRQYPGLGTVMVPSYNMSMIYDFGEYPMQFEDVLKEAQAAGFKSISTDNTSAIQDIVKQYLNSKQDEMEQVKPTSFIPTDNVLAVINNDKSKVLHLSLNKIVDYYKFQNNVGAYIASKLYGIEPIKTIIKRGNEGLPNQAYELNVNGIKFYIVKDLNENIWTVNLETNLLSQEDTRRLLKTAALTIPEGHTLATFSNFDLQQGNELNGYGFELLSEQNIINPFIGNVANYKVWKQNNSIAFYKDVTVPRNLAPARIEFDYKDPVTGEMIHSNIFNSYIIKNRIFKINQINNDKFGQKEQRIKEVEAQYNSDQVFHDLKNGKFQLEDGNYVDITNLSNKAAEIIMSDLYASKFGIKDGDSLYDVLKKGENYFEIPEVALESTNYDLIFTKNSGNHTFITFKPFTKNTDDFSTESVEWDNISKEANNSAENLASDSPKVINKIFAVTKDNVKLFEVGREVLNNDVKWDPNQKVFVDLGGKRVNNQRKYRRYGDKVLEYIEFISKHNATELTENNSYINYELYNINRSAIEKALEYKEYSDKDLSTNDGKKLTVKQKRNSEINKFISSLLADLYQTDSYSGVSMNNKLTPQTITVLNNTLKGFANKLNYDKELSNYISNLPNLFKHYKLKDDGLQECSKAFLKKEYKGYQKKIKNRIFTSFKRSLDFTVARIPAQTLQSFMKMRNVGFSGTKTGQCYVTAWQTWLQGSDSPLNRSRNKLCESGKSLQRPTLIQALQKYIEGSTTR